MLSLWSNATCAGIEPDTVQLSVSNDHPDAVIFALCTPGGGVVDEVFIAVPGKMGFSQIPIPSSKHDRYVIVYEAVTINDKTLRAKPYKIKATGRLSILQDRDGYFAMAFFTSSVQRDGDNGTYKFTSPENIDQANLERVNAPHDIIWRDYQPTAKQD